MSARPWLEVLESRLTPDSTIQVVSGVLTVDCDSAVNTVTVDHAGSTTTVNGLPFADASFNSIRINMGTGGGTVNLNATPAKPATVNQVPGGNVTVQVSPTARNLDTIQGSVLVNGGADVSTLIVNDQAHTGSTTYTLTASSVARPGRTISYGAMELVTVNGGSGVNTYNVTDTGASIRTTLNTGNGRDVANVTATASGRPLTVTGGSGGVAANFSPMAHNLNVIRGAVIVNGSSAGTDALTLNDQANPANVVFTLTASSVSRSGVAVSFNNLINTLTVNGGSGFNTYAINGTGASNLTTLNTGNVNDVVNITATSPSRPLTVREGFGIHSVNVSPTARDLDAIQGTVTVNGGAGTSSLTINDQAHAADSVYTLTASSVARAGHTINFGSLPISFVTLNGGSGNTTYNVTGTGATSLTSLNTGNSPAVVNVEGTSASRALSVRHGGGLVTINVSPTARNLDAIQGTVGIDGVSGQSTVVVNDQASTANLLYTVGSAAMTRSGTAAITFGPLQRDLNFLTVNGGSGANTYNLTDPPAHFVNTLNTGNGNDVVNVEATGHTPGLSMRLNINGGTGGVAFNFTPTARDLRAIQSRVEVNGSSGGFNSLTLNDQAEPRNEYYTLTATDVSGPVGPGVGFNRIDSLTINGCNEGNQISVLGVAANTAVTFHTGNGNDTINVGNRAHQLDDIRGRLTVDGQAGFDTLDIDDQGTSSRSYRDDGHGTFQRIPGGPTITYQSVERRIIRPGPGLSMGPGTSVVDIFGNAGDSELEIDAGSDTTINLGSEDAGLDDLQGPVTLLGDSGQGNGPIRLAINDQMTAAGQQYTLAQGSVSRTGAALISYAGIQAVEVSGGSGGNRFDVEGVSLGTPATVNTGLGDNLVRMRQHDGIGDALVVNGQGASDALGYRAYTTDVYVNLQTGTATDIASFRGIRNLTGGGGRTVLVGDGTQESLTGGTGRNLLISGGGSGQLIGGGAGDILIGGVTAYDQDPDSLLAILAYWTESADDYPTRVENLRLGNGVPQLDAGVSVFGGGAANTLTGNGDETQGVLNLFYLTQAGTITDQQPSEVAVVLDAGAAPGAGGGGPFRSRPADPAVPAVGDDPSGRPGPADLEAGPGSVAGTAELLLRSARQPGSAEQTLALELAWCDGWQPFPGLDVDVR
jgi:hypothetical protein